LYTQAYIIYSKIYYVYVKKSGAEKSRQKQNSRLKMKESGIRRIAKEEEE